MRLTTMILIALGLASCARYTERTSPCFGKGGQTVVSRSPASPLGISPTPPDLALECRFEPVMRE